MLQSSRNVGSNVGTHPGVGIVDVPVAPVDQVPAHIVQRDMESDGVSSTSASDVSSLTSAVVDSDSPDSVHNITGS